MPIDSSIYSQLRQPEPFNPLAELAQFEQLQSLQQQNKLGQLAFADRERGIADAAAQRTAVQGFGADTTANYNRLLGTGNLGAATGYQKSVAEQAKMGAETDKTQADSSAKHFDTYKAMLGTVADPQQAAQFVTASYNDPVIGPMLQKMGPLEQGLQRLSQASTTPQGFAQWRAQAAIGIEKLAEMAKTQNVNLGGTMQTQMVQPATGQVTPLASAPITQDANSMASNARIAADAQAGRAVQMRGQNMTDARSRESNSAAMSKPFEVTGPDGAPVLVQQDKQGNIAPVQGYSPKTAAAGKPLAGAAVKQLTEARDNAATIDRLTTSFKPEYAGKGVLGMGADMQLSASSNLGVDKDAVEWWKNYRKQAELVERHALFGAALTPTEQSSWRSADIGPGMHPNVIKANLATREALSKKVAENTRQDLIDAGHNDKRVNAIADRGAKASSSAVDAALKKYGGG